MNKKSITILVVCLIVSVMSVSLAFFSARIIGNGKNVSVNAKELTINFDNNNEIASGIIEPGWSSTNTFSVENKSKTTFTYDIVLKNYKNTTKTNGYLVYKITSTNGYNMTEYKDMPKDGENTYDLVIARGITIEPGSSNKQSYTLEIKYLDSTEDQSIDMGSTVTGSLYIVESTTNENNPYTKGTLGYQIMEDNSNIKTRTDFSQMYEDVNIGTMYKATEDNTDVYYFAGDVRNNWVKFGVFESDVIVYRGYNTDYPYLPFREYDTLEECQNGSDNYKNNCTMHKYASAGDPIYWRIIRTNSDGSIRLLYAGTSPDTSEGIIGVSAYNNTGYHSDPMYVGYMYGTSGSLENNKTNENSSDIKKFIDHWYEKYFINYTKYLSTTAAFCNSRVLGKNQDYSISSAFNYEAMDRLYNDTIIKPTYDCSDINDKFTVDQVAGNGKLTYPIALMTADEVSYAGGSFTKYSNNVILWYSSNSKGRDIISNYFFINDALNATPDTYLMTAMKYETTAKTATLENANRLGILRWGLNYMPNAVRPVISLKKDLLYKSGDGSASKPYEVNAEPVNMYTVSLTVNNGSGTSTVLIEEGKNATFTVTPNSGYKAELETNTCGGTLSGNTYIISNITSGKTCSITFKKKETTLADKIIAKSVNNEDNVYNEDGYRYEGSNPNNYIYMETNGTKELWRIIGLFPDGENGENVIRVRKNSYTNAEYDTNSTNHWPNTTLYTTLSSTYSTTKYKNTVNYKVYLGTNYPDDYTSKYLYDMERTLNDRGTAGSTAKLNYNSSTTAIVTVGLMYPSDYGYAVLASDCARTLTLYDYSTTSKCHDNNWLYQGSNQRQWLISPDYDDTEHAFFIHSLGYFGSTANVGYGITVTDTSYISPVMALKSDIVVTGSGTQSDPYVMK